MGVLFALNLAFLANDTWSAHDRARQAVFQEAGSLWSILALADHLPEATQSKVSQAVRNYAHLTVTVDWPMLALRQSSPAAADNLQTLLMLLSSDEVASAANTSVQSQMLQQSGQVRSMRDLRNPLSHTHVNPLEWLGMAFLGFLRPSIPYRAILGEVRSCPLRPRTCRVSILVPGPRAASSRPFCTSS